MMPPMSPIRRFEARGDNSYDPDGDARTFSLSGGGTKQDPDSNFFTIDANGLLQFKAGQVTNAGRTFSFKAKVVSSGGTDTADVNVYVPGIKEIQYTSDHVGLKLDNEALKASGNVTFADESGIAFNRAAWTPEHSDPLMQSKNTFVTLSVTLDGIPQNAVFGLIGNADDDLGKNLDFEISAQKGTGNKVQIKLTAKVELPDFIGQVDKAISWTLTVNGQAFELPSTRNKIYVTYGKPQGVVTEKRINWLTLAANGQNDLDGIVADIQRESLPYGVYANAPPLAPGQIWSFLDGAPSECDEHAKLIEAAVKMLGVTNANGTPAGKVYYIFPKNNALFKGDIANNRDFNVEHLNGNTNIDLQYRGKDGLDHRFEAVYRIDVRAKGAPQPEYHYYAGFDPVRNRAIPFFTSVNAVMEGVADGLTWYNKVSFDRTPPFQWPVQ